MFIFLAAKLIAREKSIFLEHEVCGILFFSIACAFVVELTLASVVFGRR